MAARKQPGAKVEVKIPKMNNQVITAKIAGSMLVVHKFSEKSRKQMEDKQQGVAQMKKPPKVPHEEFLGALHVIGKKLATGEEGERYGFPASAIKKAMVSACRQVDALPMTKAKGAFHIIGLQETRGELLEIKTSKPPEMRTDMVRLETGVADVRYRPQFDDWEIEVTIDYNANVITPDALLNLLNVAGYAVGLGENRPDKSGDSWGRFRVVMGDEEEEKKTAA